MAKTNTAAVVNETTAANETANVETAAAAIETAQTNGETTPETAPIETPPAAAPFVPQSEKLTELLARKLEIETAMLTAGNLIKLRELMAELETVDNDIDGETAELIAAENARIESEKTAALLAPLNDYRAAVIANVTTPTPENADAENVTYDALKLIVLGGKRAAPRKPAAAAVDGSPAAAVPADMYLNAAGVLMPKLTDVQIVDMWRSHRRAGKTEKETNALMNDVVAPRSTVWHNVDRWKKTPAGAAVIASNKF